MAEYFLNLLLISSIYLSLPVVYFARVVSKKNKSAGDIQGLYASAFVIAGFLIAALGQTVIMVSEGPFPPAAFIQIAFGPALFGMLAGVLVGNLVGYFMRSHHQEESSDPDFAEDQDGNPIVPPKN